MENNALNSKYPNVNLPNTALLEAGTLLRTNKSAFMAFPGKQGRASVSYQHPEITFEKEAENALTVTIVTEDLQMKSTSHKDLDDYVKLLGDPENTEKFGDGQFWSSEKTQACINTWVNRWKENDPFCAFAVRVKGNDDFAGHVILGHGEISGESELAYIFNKKFWKGNRSSYVGRDFEGRSVGLQSVSAVVNYYAPKIKREKKEFKLQGKPFQTVVATARADNTGSIRILEKVGMNKIKIEEKYGSKRIQFKASVEELEIT